jgi:hypothetical protein
MKKFINIDNTTIIPLEYVIATFALLILLVSISYIGWKTKGVLVCMGIVLTILGLITIYLSLTDKTL